MGCRGIGIIMLMKFCEGEGVIKSEVPCCVRVFGI